MLRKSLSINIAMLTLTGTIWLFGGSSVLPAAEREARKTSTLPDASSAHPRLLLRRDQRGKYSRRAKVDGSLNKKYFDAIQVCSSAVPSPAEGWDPPLTEFSGTPHQKAVDTTRRAIMAAAHSALKYGVDPVSYGGHGSAAAACAMDVIDKWNPQEIINQYRSKIDGSQDEHEGAQLVIYMALVYDMAYDQFTPEQRQLVIDWLALGAVTLGESEKDHYPEYESYARQNHPACCILGCGFACLALQDEIDQIGDATLQATMRRHLREMNQRIPTQLLDRDALADGRTWEGAAYGSYTLPFALLWGQAYNNAYDTNVFSGKGIEKIIRWYAHQRAAYGPAQMVEYGDDYDRYGGFGEMLILFEQGSADGHDLWLLNSLHPGGDIFAGPLQTEQGYTDRFLTYPLFFPHELQPVTPEVAGQRPTQYFRDFRDRSGGEIHFKNRFVDHPIGEDTVQMVLYSHRDEISKGGLAQGSIRFYAYGEKFTEEEGRGYRDPAWWGSMKQFTTFDYFNPNCGHDGSLPKYQFYAQRKNPGLGRVEGFIASEFVDYARADGRFPLGDPSLTAASHRNNANIRIACSPSDDPSKPTYCQPVNRADRMVMLLKSSHEKTVAAKPYFIIVDDVNIDGHEQLYRWRWHAPRMSRSPKTKQPLNQGTLHDFVIDGQGSIDSPFCVYDPQLERTKTEITFLAPTKFDFGISQFAPEGTINHRLLEVKHKAIDPVYMAILFPRKASFERPEITLLTVDGAGAAGGVIHWNPQLVDTLLTGRGEMIFGANVATNGRLACVRTLGDEVVEYALGEGNQLSLHAQPLVADVQGSGSITLSAHELALTGNITSGRFWAPQIERVMLNDQSVTFAREGSYVRILGGKLP